MAATFVSTATCLLVSFSVGLYFYHRGNKTAGEAREKSHKTEIGNLYEKIDKLQEKNDKLKKKSDYYLKLVQERNAELNELRKQMIPAGAPVNQGSSPPRRESRLSEDRESSPPLKGSSRRGSSRYIDNDWAITTRRRPR